MIRQSTEDRILAELKYGGKSIRELGDCIDSNTRGIYRAIGVLEKGGYINKVNGKYSPTPIGKLFGSIADETIRIREVVEEYKEYISSHQTDCIPEHLLKRLLLLPDIKIGGDDTDPAWIEKFITDFILQTEKNLLGITSVVADRWIDAGYEVAERGCKLVLIVTDEVFMKVREYKDIPSPLYPHPNVQWFINNDIKFAFGSNRKSITMSFFDRTGLDIRRNIMSNRKEAMKWGDGLFEYFKIRSIGR